MAQPTFDSTQLKQLLKEAFTETLHEQRDLLHDVLLEVLEDLALREAIQEGQASDPATRDEIFSLLK